MQSLTRSVAIAAIVGGGLRVAAEAFVRMGVNEATLQQLYFTTDFALLLGLGGIVAMSATRLGLPGLFAYSLFLFGILLVRSPNVPFLQLSGYRAGAALALLGVTVLGALMLQRSVLHRAPYLWFAALLGGVVGAAGLQPTLLVPASGVLFGLGCVTSGIETLLSSARKEKGPPLLTAL